MKPAKRARYLGSKEADKQVSKETAEAV